MKSLIKRIFLFGFPTLFVLFFLTLSILKYLFNREFNFESISIASLAYALCQTAAFMLGTWVALTNKFKVLETETPIENRFGNIEQTVKLDSPKLDFEKILQTVTKEFIVTYSNKSNNTIKLREQMRIWSWGSAAIITVDSNNSSIKVNAFPLGNSTKSKLTKDLITKIEQSLKH